MKLAFPIAMAVCLAADWYFANEAAKTAGSDAFDRNIQLANVFQALSLCSGLVWVAVAA